MLNRIFTVDTVSLTSTGTAVSTYMPFDLSARKLPTQVVLRATGNGAYVRLSDDQSAATSADMLVLAGDHAVVLVQGRHWVSVLNVSGSSTVNVGALSTGVWGSAATLDLPFTTGTVDPRITFTRASTATYFNSDRILTSAAVDAPRFDYNPSTLAAQGLLIEEARTNSIRNSSGVGAVNGVIGSGGAVPTNWFFTVQTTTGLTRTIVGTGTESGISYIDLRLNGTATGAGAVQIGFELTNSVAGLTGQSWTPSLYWKLAAGSLTGLTNPVNALNEYTSAAVFVTSNTAAITSPTTASLATQRQATAITTNGGATTAFVQPLVQLTIANGAAIDITLRIGLPQLELGAFATSVIPTSTVAVTRSADVASVNTLSPWFNSAAGTIYSEFQSIGQTTTAKIAVLDNGAGFADSLDQYLSSGAPRFDVYVSSSTQASLTPAGGAIALNTTTKFSSAYAVNDFAASRNGGTVLTDASGTVPTVSRLLLGNATLSTQFLNGYLRRITYYPRRLTNAELQTITA